MIKRILILISVFGLWVTFAPVEVAAEGGLRSYEVLVKVESGIIDLPGGYGGGIAKAPLVRTRIRNTELRELLQTLGAGSIERSYRLKEMKETSEVKGALTTLTADRKESTEQIISPVQLLRKKDKELKEDAGIEVEELADTFVISFNDAATAGQARTDLNEIGVVLDIR